jgi:hypothetical protein
MTEKKAQELLARAIPGIIYDIPIGAFTRKAQGIKPSQGSTRITLRQGHAAWMSDLQLQEGYSKMLGCNPHQVNIYVDEHGFVTLWYI